MKISTKIIIVFLIGLYSSFTFAGIVVDGTRFIYRGGDREVDVRITNNANAPLIAQSWIDNGPSDKNKPIDEISVPFNLTPPVARVDPEKGQTLRIFATKNDFPLDRESIYWLNILEIPPKNKEATGNRIEFTIKTILKLIYRPKEIGKDVPADAYKKITWKLVKDKSGKSYFDVYNPTPYYFTFPSVELKNGTKTPIAMVAPMSSINVFPEKGSFDSISELSTYYINDWGVSQSATFPVSK